MKKKLFAIAIIALTLCSFSLNAQQPQANNNLQIQESSVARPGTYRIHKYDGPAMMSAAKKNSEACLKGIDLTAEQKSKIEKLHKENRKKHDKQREKSAKERKKNSEKMDKEMKKILTPQQYAQYKSNKENLQKPGKKEFSKKHKASNSRHGKDCKPGKKHKSCCSKECCSTHNKKQGKNRHMHKIS